jgi:hypothetical protein
MTFLQLFGIAADSAAPSARARSRSARGPAASSAVEKVEVDARDLPWAWRSKEARLVVTSSSPMGRGRPVAVTVSGVAGLTDPAYGKVTGTEVSAGVCYAEVELDEDGRALVKRALEFQRGEGAGPKARAPRQRMVLPAVVNSSTGTAYMKTFSVSLGGCGLKWSGSPPRVGEGILVRLGSTARSAAFRAKVCWVRDRANGQRVGVRFLAGEETKLAAILRDPGIGAAAS